MECRVCIPTGICQSVKYVKAQMVRKRCFMVCLTWSRELILLLHPTAVWKCWMSNGATMRFHRKTGWKMIIPGWSGALLMVPERRFFLRWKCRIGCPLVSLATAIWNLLMIIIIGKMERFSVIMMKIWIWKRHIMRKWMVCRMMRIW